MQSRSSTTNPYTKFSGIMSLSSEIVFIGFGVDTLGSQLQSYFTIKKYYCRLYYMTTGTVMNLVLCNCIIKLFLVCFNKWMIFHCQFIILKTWNICCKFIIFINYRTLNMQIMHLVRGILFIILDSCGFIYGCNNICFLSSSICSDVMLLPSFNIFSSCTLFGRTSSILRSTIIFISESSAIFLPFSIRFILITTSCFI